MNKRLKSYGIVAALLLILSFCSSAYGVAQNRALLIGISQYTELNSLRYADADVLAFSQLLTDFGGYKKTDVDLLLNQQATKARIVEAINKVIRDSEKQPIDHFILMFAGHGVPGQINNKTTSIFLAPSDASTTGNNFYSTGNEVVNETFISKAWLARQLSAIHAKSILIVLDSCYSGTRDFGKLFLENEGYTVESFGTEGSQKGVAVVQRNLMVSKNSATPQDKVAVASRQVAYFASSRDDQPSAEYEELQHGALSYSIFEYVRRVQREVYDDDRKNLTVDDVYSNVTKLFHEVKVEGRTLDQVNQPILMAVPDFASIKDMGFISVQGVRKREIQKIEPGILEINTDPQGVEISVDGVRRPEATNAHLELPEGKHLIELYIPSTSYRYSFTADIVPSETVRKDISMRGILEVASFWLKDGVKSPGPPLDVFLDGEAVGQSNLRLDKLQAGAHLLEVHFQNLIKQRRIEIRPDSPLTVNYSIIREAAPEKKPDRGVGNVVF